MEIQSLLTLLLVIDYSIIYYSSYKSRYNPNYRVLQIHIKEILIIREEYRVANIFISKYVVDILIFFLVVLYYLNYFYVFHYYTKAILLDNLGYLFKDFDLSRVLVIALIGIYSISVLICWFLIEVKSNLLDIFSRLGLQTEHEIAMFTFVVIVIILALLGLLVISYNINIVLHRINSNEFNQIRFPFIRV